MNVLREQLARDILTMAYDGGMPDTFWSTDRRILRACEVLGVNIGAAAQEMARLLKETST